MRSEAIVNRSLAKELHSYSVEQWCKWVDDIVMYGVAYPVSSFSKDGDVLKEMFDFLHVNDIEVFNYEHAISLTIEKSLRNILLSERAEKLMDSLVNIDLEYTKQCLIGVVTNSEVGLRKGRYDFLASKAIQVISRTRLTQDQVKIVYEQSFYYLANQFKTTASFIGNFLRFIRTHKSIDTFWNVLTHCIISQQDHLNEKDEARILTVLFDKILELQYWNRGLFYSSTYFWLTNNLYANIDNSLFEKFLLRVYDFLKSDNKMVELNSLSNDSGEKAYGKALIFIFDIYFEKSLQELSITDWERNLLFIRKESATCLESLKRTKLPNIVETYFEKSGNNVRLKKVLYSVGGNETDDFKFLIIELLFESSRTNINKRDSMMQLVEEEIKQAK